MRPDPETFAERLKEGDRAVLGQAITLVESRSAKHRLQAAALIEQVIDHNHSTYRIGISGVPGVGKSTFIDSFGVYLTSLGHRVAVLAVDPTSVKTGGSILGDKTRMQRLSVDPQAFIRPSPSSLTLGGVAEMTREAMILCEAAGYDVILVETVGVGQSEVTVAGMTDFFLMLALPGAGDELQGIKKGILELADLIAVNKAEGDQRLQAEKAARHYRNALRILEGHDVGWSTQVQLISALAEIGIDDIWQTCLEHQAWAKETQTFTRRRAEQQKHWMWSIIQRRLREHFGSSPSVMSKIRSFEQGVEQGRISPGHAADQLFRLFAGDLTRQA